MSKTNGLIIISAIGAVLGGTWALGDYIYKVSAKPHEHTDDEGDFDESITEGRLFVRNHGSKKDIYINSYDSLKLHASFIPAKEESHTYVIILHGIWDNHESVGNFAKHYIEKGYSCLLPDLRGFGESEGHYIGYGLDDRLDIKEWIDWIIRKDPDATIILHGKSMGAATVLMTTGETLPKNVVCAISDSSFTTLPEQFLSSYKKFKGSIIPKPLALALARIMIKLRADYDIRDVAPIKAVANSGTPTLFMHGDADTFIDPHMCSRLYEAASCPRQYCIILGADHVRGVVTDPNSYWKKVDKFVAKYLNQK